MFDNIFIKSFRLCDVEKYGTAGQAIEDNLVHSQCMLYN
jgi:hypothetical protein